MWIFQLEEIRFGNSTPMKLQWDNQEAIHNVFNRVFYECTKHVDCHFIQEKLQHKIIKIGYVRTWDQLADAFTKSLNVIKISNICSKLHMHNIYALAWGRICSNILMHANIYMHDIKI